ncbi:MAG: universal stress protein [Bacteroidota bacterium]
MNFDKILLPVDFSPASDRALSYAIQVSQQHDAELILLHAFRLIHQFPLPSTINRVDIKRELERRATLNFAEWDKQLNHLGLHYSFVSEVGFVDERIVSTVNTRNISLVILYDEIQKKVMEMDANGQERLIRALHCPVMLLPVAG